MKQLNYYINGEQLTKTAFLKHIMLTTGQDLDTAKSITDGVKAFGKNGVQFKGYLLAIC